MKKYIPLILIVLFSTFSYAFLEEYPYPSAPEFSQAKFNPATDKVLLAVDNFGQLTYLDFVIESENIGILFNLKDEDVYVNHIYTYYSDDEKLFYLIAVDEYSEIRYKGTKLPKMDPGSLVSLDKNGNLLEMRFTSSAKGDFITPIGTAIVKYKKEKNKETYIIQNGGVGLSGSVNFDFLTGNALIEKSTLSLGDKSFKIFGKESLDIGGYFFATVPTNLKLENSKITLGRERYVGKVINKPGKLDLNILTGKLKENANLEIIGLTELTLKNIYANIKQYQATFQNSLTGSLVRINQLNIEEFLKKSKQ